MQKVNPSPEQLTELAHQAIHIVQRCHNVNEIIEYGFEWVHFRLETSHTCIWMQKPNVDRVVSRTGGLMQIHRLVVEELRRWVNKFRWLGYWIIWEAGELLKWVLNQIKDMVIKPNNISLGLLHQQNVFQSLGASRSVWEEAECKHRRVNFRRKPDLRKAFRPAIGVTGISDDWYGSTIGAVVKGLGAPGTVAQPMRESLSNSERCRVHMDIHWKECRRYPRFSGLVLDTGLGNLPVVWVRTVQRGRFGSRPDQKPNLLHLGRLSQDPYPSTGRICRVWLDWLVLISRSAFRVFLI